MKHIITIVSILIVTTTLSIGCQKEEEGISPDDTSPDTTVQDTITIEPPTNLRILADNSGKMVVLIWEASLTENIDGYRIYFKPIGGQFEQIATLDPSVTQTAINPLGETGYYHVTAFRGEIESEPTEDVSTIPIHTSSMTIYELDSGGNSGCGWNRETGEGMTYAMNVSANARYVDFYMTNFATGYSALPYYLSSPDISQFSRDSIVIPNAPWKVNGILSISSELADSLLPAPGNYYAYVELLGDSYYAVHAEDNYYGVIHTINPPNISDGTQSIETWFQLIRGLRLVKHSPDTHN